MKTLEKSIVCRYKGRFLYKSEETKSGKAYCLVRAEDCVYYQRNNIHEYCIHKEKYKK